MKNLIEKYLTENKYKDLPITPNQERQAVINEEKFSVYRSGGSVGSSKKSGEKYNKKGDLFIKDFDSKDDAKAFAKERTKRLSPGEKKYYKMKYYVESADKYAGKLDESSGNSGSTELWFGSWSRPLLIYVQENEVLWSYNHDFPPGYYMTDDDRQRARARGYIILDI